MLKIKQLFCKHKYRKIKCIRDYNYCTDYMTFSDTGMWYRVEEKCKKCGKEKIFHVSDKR